MLELNIYQNQNQNAGNFGKWYARVEGKEQMSVYDMAVHMAKHNTPFSAGTIEGILRDFVDCVREQCLQGNTVKIDNLAIFKATVEANALETLYDAQADKTASATIGTLKDSDKTGAAVKTIKLLAQSTGDFTRDELKKDVKLSWTDKTKAEITAAKGGNVNDNANDNENQGGGSNSGNNGSTENGGTTNGGNENTGGGDNNGGVEEG